MQHFKFENWRIGGLENSIFDVTNRLLNFSNQVRRASSGSIRLRRSNSPICRRRERRLTRISLTIVWLFLFCHIWKLVPTAYEVIYGDDHFPMWTHYIKNLSHALIVLNSSVNFIIYVML